MSEDRAWQEEAAEALSFLAPAEEWDFYGGDLCLPEDPDGENPGFLIWLDGDRMRLSWGCIDFESDVQHGDYALTARWLMDAAAAWGVKDE